MASPDAAPAFQASWQSAPSALNAWVVLLPIGILGALCCVMYRQGILLSYDGFHYCEMAKQFSESWPDHLGDYWPFGWPLAAGLIARTGVFGAYSALRFLAVLSFAAIVFMMQRALKEPPIRLWIACAFATIPVNPVQTVSVLTELPFTSFVLGLAMTLGGLNGRKTVWCAAFCCLGGFLTRYAGVLLPGAWMLWLLLHRRVLKRRRELSGHLVGLSVTGLLMVLLIWTNVVTTGSPSGGERGPFGSLVHLPRQLALFGWSAPSALVAGGIRDAIGPETGAGLAIGAFCFAAIASFVGWCWVCPATSRTRTIVLVALTYAVGMAALRCVAYFDGVYNARTFLPEAPLLLILMAERTKPAVSTVICSAMMALGIIAAVRGVSRQTGADVRPAISPLIEALKAGGHSTIGINEHAYTVSAYVDARIERVFIRRWMPSQDTTFFVIAGRPLLRSSIHHPLSPQWREAVAQLVTTRGYKVLLDNGDLVLLQKSAKPSP